MAGGLISSAANPRVKVAAELRNRRERDARGLTIVDGVRELDRALAAGAEVVEAFVCPPLCMAPERRLLLGALRDRAVRIVEVTEAVIGRLAYGDRSEGIVGIVRIPSLGLERLRLPRDPLVVVLEAVEKPGNLGAVLRGADGAGADALIAADPHTDLYNPNAIRASLGTIFSVQLATATTAETLAWLRAERVTVVAARPDAERTYSDVDLRGPLAIVLGSEAEGLTDAWDAPDIVAARLPMLGRADSLNVSVAAAVLLYEARRQRATVRPRRRPPRRA